MAKRLEMNPIAQKAVLIMEGDKGQTMVATVYEPRIEQDYPDEFSVSSINRVTFLFKEAQMIVYAEPGESGRVEAAEKAYADAITEFDGDNSLPVRPNPEDLQKYIAERERYALDAVYLAGIEVGSKHVQFQDDYVTRKHQQEVMAVYNTIHSRLDFMREVARDRGSRAYRGLRRAVRAVEELIEAEKVRATKR